MPGFSLSKSPLILSVMSAITLHSSSFVEVVFRLSKLVMLNINLASLMFVVNLTSDNSTLYQDRQHTPRMPPNKVPSSPLYMLTS